MRVFVLSTGRCGSTTFVEACHHLSGFTAGHETLAGGRLFGERFDYADSHIESDNRLAWFLGALGERFDGTDCLYVHLTRDRESVASSFARRWNSGYGGGIIRAFANGILMTAHTWGEEELLDVCRFYVDTVNANITEFLRSRQSLSVAIEQVDEDFDRFLDRIEATGDLAAARREWTIPHNASS